HGRVAALGGRGTLAQERSEVDQRDEAAAQRGETAHRLQGARHLQHLAQVADLEHASQRQAVRLTLGADQEIARAHRVARLVTRLRTNSIMTRSAICPSGRTASTPPACTAAAGIPGITDDSRSWAMPPPPASPIARSPSAPSPPIPVSTTPTPRPPDTAPPHP